MDHHPETTILALPIKQALRAKFPPGCHVLCCGHHSSCREGGDKYMHGIVQAVGIDLDSPTRENVYKIQILEESSSNNHKPASIIVTKREEELQFAPYTEVWLKLLQQQQQPSATNNNNNQIYQEGIILSLEEQHWSRSGSDTIAANIVTYYTVYVLNCDNPVTYSKVPIQNLSARVLHSPQQQSPSSTAITQQHGTSHSSAATVGIKKEQLQFIQKVHKNNVNYQDDPTKKATAEVSSKISVKNEPVPDTDNNDNQRDPNGAAISSRVSSKAVLQNRPAEDGSKDDPTCSTFATKNATAKATAKVDIKNKTVHGIQVTHTNPVSQEDDGARLVLSSLENSTRVTPLDADQKKKASRGERVETNSRDGTTTSSTSAMTKSTNTNTTTNKKSQAPALPSSPSASTMPTDTPPISHVRVRRTSTSTLSELSCPPPSKRPKVAITKRLFIPTESVTAPSEEESLTMGRSTNGVQSKSGPQAQLSIRRPFPKKRQEVKRLILPESFGVEFFKDVFIGKGGCICSKYAKVYHCNIFLRGMQIVADTFPTDLPMYLEIFGDDVSSIEECFQRLLIRLYNRCHTMYRGCLMYNLAKLNSSLRKSFEGSMVEAPLNPHEPDKLSFITMMRRRNTAQTLYVQNNARELQQKHARELQQKHPLCRISVVKKSFCRGDPPFKCVRDHVILAGPTFEHVVACRRVVFEMFRERQKTLQVMEQEVRLPQKKKRLFY